MGTIIKKRELFSKTKNETLDEQTISIEDITNAFTELAEECAMLEVQNNKECCTRAVNKSMRLEKLAIMMKTRLRAIKTEISYSRK